jgi:hypothetical protein
MTDSGRNENRESISPQFGSSVGFNIRADYLDLRSQISELEIWVKNKKPIP